MVNTATSTPSPKPSNALGIPAFQPGTSDAAKKKKAGDFPTSGFALSAYQEGLRSPDAIDRPGNYLEITTSLNTQSMPAEQMTALQHQLVLAGFLPKEFHQYGFLNADTQKALVALKETARMAGLSDMTALQRQVEQNLSVEQGDAAAAQRAKGPVTTTRTDTSTTHFDDLDARAMANDAYAQATGRAAVGREAAGVQAALNAYASAHPQISTTTQTVQPDGDVTANTTSRGGITAAGASQIVEDQAMAADDYAEFQAAGVYMPALERMAGAISNVRGR